MKIVKRIVERFGTYDTKSRFYRLSLLFGLYLIVWIWDGKDNALCLYHDDYILIREWEV